MVDVGTREVKTWQPPWWLLVVAPLGWLLISALVVARRGWIVGLVALVLLAPVGLPVPALLRWLRRPRRRCGAYLGPVVFSGFAIATSLPLWVCIAAGLGGAFLGLMVGAMRDFARD